MHHGKLTVGQREIPVRKTRLRQLGHLPRGAHGEALHVGAAQSKKRRRRRGRRVRQGDL